jgi:hypothetical protein
LNAELERLQTSSPAARRQAREKAIFGLLQYTNAARRKTASACCLVPQKSSGSAKGNAIKERPGTKMPGLGAVRKEGAYGVRKRKKLRNGWPST